MFLIRKMENIMVGQSMNMFTEIYKEEQLCSNPHFIPSELMLMPVRRTKTAKIQSELKHLNKSITIPTNAYKFTC